MYNLRLSHLNVCIWIIFRLGILQSSKTYYADVVAGVGCLSALYIRVYVSTLNIGVGDGPNSDKSYFFGQKSCKIRAFCFFSGIYHVKFGNFVNSSCIYFRAKMSCPPKLTELLRLWSLEVY